MLLKIKNKLEKKKRDSRNRTQFLLDPVRDRPIYYHSTKTLNNKYNRVYIAKFILPIYKKRQHSDNFWRISSCQTFFQGFYLIRNLSIRKAYLYQIPQILDYKFKKKSNLRELNPDHVRDSHTYQPLYQGCYYTKYTLNNYKGEN
ncbi:hypothetical protein pb186bvf_017328 [Paramecium bursaria]